jgi:peptide-methionine (S)-S-oxide reductase
LLSSLILSRIVLAEENDHKRIAVAIFAGGCFWCMEPPFDALPGVIGTVSGYTGGDTENPTYEDVSKGGTGHSEAVQITFDPTRVGYEKLLEVFWHNIDPFNDKGQFCDRGDQYKATIFYLDENQKQLAEASKIEIRNKLHDKDIATLIKPARKFYPAEENHQDYYLQNPIKYNFFRFTCGRDYRLNQVWGE